MKFLLIFLMGMAATIRANDQLRPYCGRVLAQAYATICYGFDPDHVALVHSDQPLSSAETNIELNAAEMPERSVYRARRLMNDKISARRADLVEACCYKPCHLSEILNHC